MTVRALVLLGGLILGLLLGGSLVIANPLAWFSGLPPLPADLAPEKAYRWENYQGMGFGLDGLLGLSRPSPTQMLTDPTLAEVGIGIVQLPPSADSPASLAVKIWVLAPENALGRARLGTEDYWNIFFLGEGSVFAAGHSNFWGLARKRLFALALGDGNPGDTPLPLSSPSPRDGATDDAGVFGAAGRYAGFTGEIRESLYPATQDAAGLTWDKPEGSTEGEDWVLAVQITPPPLPSRGDLRHF